MRRAPQLRYKAMFKDGNEVTCDSHLRLVYAIRLGDFATVKGIALWCKTKKRAASLSALMKNQKLGPNAGEVAEVRV